ncbi:MAG: hypothetical protein ACE14V_00230 [bacterium]
MKLGKTEKTVAVAVSALGLIAVIHFILYRPQSSALSEINKQWSAAAAQYQEFYKYDLSQKEILSIDSQVNYLAASYDSAKHVLQFSQSLDASKGNQAILEALQTLKQTEKNSGKTLVKIFANWNITDDVPGLDPRRIPDYLDDLKTKKAVLKLPNLDPTLKQEFTAKYYDTKKKLGFNTAELGQMPPLVAYLKQLKIYSYIKTNLGDNYRVSDKELFDLLELSSKEQKNVGDYLFILKNANNLVKLAIDCEVDAVSALNLNLEEPTYRPSDKPAATPVTSTITQPGRFPGRSPMFDGPGAPPPEMGGPPRGMAPVEGAGGPMFRAPTQVATPAAPTAKPIATAWPIEIKIKANNLAFNKFLYGVSNSPALAEIKEIEVQALDEGKVQVRLKVYYYTGFTAT